MGRGEEVLVDYADTLGSFDFSPYPLRTPPTSSVPPPLSHPLPLGRGGMLGTGYLGHPVQSPCEPRTSEQSNSWGAT